MQHGRSGKQQLFSPLFVHPHVFRGQAKLARVATACCYSQKSAGWLSDLSSEEPTWENSPLPVYRRPMRGTHCSSVDNGPGQMGQRTSRRDPADACGRLRSSRCEKTTQTSDVCGRVPLPSACSLTGPFSGGVQPRWVVPRLHACVFLSSGGERTHVYTSGSLNPDL